MQKADYALPVLLAWHEHLNSGAGDNDLFGILEVKSSAIGEMKAQQRAGNALEQKPQIFWAHVYYFRT